MTHHQRNLLKHLRNKATTIAGVYISAEEIRRDPALAERLWRALTVRPLRELWTITEKDARTISERADAVSALYRAVEHADRRTIATRCCGRATASSTPTTGWPP